MVCIAAAAPRVGLRLAPCCVCTWAGLSIAWATSSKRERAICKQTFRFCQLPKGLVTIFAWAWVIPGLDLAHIAVALIFLLTIAVENLVLASAALARWPALLAALSFASIGMALAAAFTLSFSGPGIVFLTLALGFAFTIGKVLCILVHPVAVLQLVPDARHCVL